MNKIAYTLLAIFFAFVADAQKDSLKKIRFSAIQLDIGPSMYPEYRQQNQTDYRRFIKTDENLDAELSTYKNQSGYYYGIYNGIVGFKCYATINPYKKMGREVFAGLRYCQEFNTGAYYYKSKYDTISVFTNSMGRKLYEVIINEGSYSYGIHSQKLIVPLGFNFTTDKTRLFWVTCGVELAPAINFNYVFRSTHSEHFEDVFVYEGDSIDNWHNYNNNSYKPGVWKTKATKLDGMSFGCSAALPFTVYLHPFKRTVFLRHLNALASITPVFFYTRSKFAGDAHMATISLATGIRYNW